MTTSDAGRLFRERQAAALAAEAEKMKRLKRKKAAMTAPVHDEVVDPETYGRRIVKRSLEHDTLRTLFLKKRIDEETHAAGEKFHELWVKAQLSPCRSMDYSRQRVDGGRVFGDISVAQQQAHKELALIAKAIGYDKYLIICAVVGGGHSLRSLAGRWHAVDKSSLSVEAYRSKLTVHILDALGALVAFMNAGEKKRDSKLQFFCREYDPLLSVDDRGFVINQELSRGATC